VAINIWDIKAGGVNRK